jgi:hypothetical protein
MVKPWALEDRNRLRGWFPLNVSPPAAIARNTIAKGRRHAAGSDIRWASIPSPIGKRSGARAVEQADAESKTAAKL